MQSLLNEKICYNIFDKTYVGLSNVYSTKFKGKFSLYEVLNNIRYVANYLSVSKIVILNQTHSNKVINYKNASSKGFYEILDCDGAITSEANVALSVQTADCVPVLLFSKSASMVGAIHCGWRGSKNNIIKRAADMIRKTEGGDIYAIIGPAIQQRSYSVGEDLYRLIMSDSTNKNSKYFINNKNMGYFFDLYNFVIDKVQKEQIKIIKIIKEDTFVLSSKYYSYRWMLKTNKYDSKQRILSTIYKKS